jgi:hypothetical protein
MTLIITGKTYEEIEEIAEKENSDLDLINKWLKRNQWLIPKSLTILLWSARRKN